MNIGDIGVLQHLTHEIAHYNGLVAEIVDTVGIGDKLGTPEMGFFRARTRGLIVKCCDEELAIVPMEIRPINDPDAKEIEEVEELTA